jgi:8-oxo-dGTP pyrophosphatase MutT (NUDIX family)
MSMIDPLALDGPNPWRTRARRVVYDNGRLQLHEDDVVQPDGEAGRYTYLELPHPIVVVVPLTAAGEVHLVRQWRYPWQQNSWEIPAGHGEPAETALQSAHRELAEEVGLVAATWDALGTGFSSATVSARYHLFLARDLSPAPAAHQRDGAEQDLITCVVPFGEALRAAADGRLQHAMSALALLRAARLLGLLGV